MSVHRRLKNSIAADMDGLIDSYVIIVCSLEVIFKPFMTFGLFNLSGEEDSPEEKEKVLHACGETRA